MLMDPVGQEFGQDTVEMACFCSMMSGTSARTTQRLGARILCRLICSQAQHVGWDDTKAETGTGTPMCAFSRWLGSLPAWQPPGSWASYLVTQGSKSKCSREKGRAGSPSGPSLGRRTDSVPLGSMA